jgi:competence protein ComEC
MHFPYIRNEASCVLRVHSAHGAALLMGDVGEIIEREMMRREPQAIRADVVLAGHHGSRTSSDPTFVNATGASHSLVSAGYGNRFGHPHEQVEYRWTRAGAEVLSTATGGALRVRLGEGGTTVEQRRLAHPRLWDAQRRLAVDETLQERQ